MTRDQFDHAVRAAGSILGENRILVIGSQAIHATLDTLPPEAMRSIEVDVASFVDADGRKADLIDGAIGELSVFQDTFGYYAQGVTPDTAVLPDGWRDRLIAYSSPSTNGVTAMCLEPHDLWLSKAVAGRPKDREYCSALIKTGAVDTTVLESRMSDFSDIPEAIRARVLGLVKQQG